MKLRLTNSARLRSILAAALACFCASFLHGAPVRVLTWNLLPKELPAPADAQKLSDAELAETTRIIQEQKPDVIVLQQIPDPSVCVALLRSLRPAEFQVAVISAFHDPAATNSRLQTAIISRAKSSESGSEAWKTDGLATAAPGGLVSAVIHLENRDLTVVGIQMSPSRAPEETDWSTVAAQTAREQAARQIVSRLDGLGASMPVVIAGDFNAAVDDAKISSELTLARLERAGFSNVFGSLPPQRRVTLAGNGKHSDLTVDYIFAREPIRNGNVQIIPASTTLHNPVVADLELPAPKPLAAAALAGAGTGSEAAHSPSQFINKIGAGNLAWLAGMLAAGLLLIAVAMILISQSPGSGGAMGLAMVAPPAGGSAQAVPSANEILVMTRSTQTGTLARSSESPEAEPVVHVRSSAGTETADASDWQQRALQAERKAERAKEALRAGLLPQLAHWLKSALTRQLISDRAQLIEAQRTAAMKIQGVDERLTKVELHLQARAREYETRIAQLEKELLVTREENRELIRAKITQLRGEMERERTRLLQQAAI